MGVVFCDVHFAYPGREPILRGMDLRIDEGERIALLGASGSGKSTLAALMLRSIVPAKGRILQEGVPIAHIPLGLYLSQIGYVGQEAHLFRSTVEDNLRLSWPAATESHLWSTLEVVGMRDVIEQLPQGLKTPLGAGGATLSGGQKQRLCLARALLRDPRLLILDEFTSALDQPTEKAILDQLLEHGPPVGILCITHSPTVARRFARKLELHEGLLRPMESTLQAS
jgi:ATP-binding cassette subfamily B protein